MISGRLWTQIGLRRVLDELERFAAEDHGAGRGREVLPDLELAFVHLARHAEIVGEVVDEILQAVQQALAACLGDPLQRARDCRAANWWARKFR